VTRPFSSIRRSVAKPVKIGIPRRRVISSIRPWIAPPLATIRRPSSLSSTTRARALTSTPRAAHDLRNISILIPMKDGTGMAAKGA
jgi:hypothetical protein